MNEPFGQITLQLGKLKDKISDDEYFEVCQINEFLVIERNQIAGSVERGERLTFDGCILFS